MLHYITLLFFIICFYSTVFSNTRNNVPNYFLGGQIIYNFRTGSHFFKHLEMRQDTVKEKLLLGGFSLGKRYYISSWARFQVSTLFHFGSVKELSSSIKYKYKHIGVDLDMHLIKNINNITSIFFLCGGGINRMKMECEGSNCEIRSWAPSMNTGLGYDYRIEKDIMLTFSYLYRFWRPIAYSEGTDFPFEPIKYQETFYSHILKIDLVFNLFN